MKKTYLNVGEMGLSGNGLSGKRNSAKRLFGEVGFGETASAKWVSAKRPSAKWADTGSLAVQDEFNEMDYREFLLMSKNVEERAGTGSEPLPGNFLNPKTIDTNLTKEVLNLLVEYYHNAYDKEFAALSNI